MLTRHATVGSRSGLHSRPAATIAKAAAALGTPVRIGRDTDRLVNAASLLSLISLGVAQGDSVVVEIDDDTQQAGLDGLIELLEKDLDQA